MDLLSTFVTDEGDTDGEDLNEEHVENQLRNWLKQQPPQERKQSQH